MAKKRASRKPKYDIDQAELQRQNTLKVDAKFNQQRLQNRVVGTPPSTNATPLGKASQADMKYASTQRQEMEKQFRQFRRQEKVAGRILNDIARNLPNNTRTFAMGPAKGDSMRGRTVEYGTRSMLQGLRSWIAGGGGSRLSGR